MDTMNKDLVKARQEAAKMPKAAGIHFSAPFIKRPVATTLMSIAIILAGAVAYTLLPVASLPQVEFPVISVGAGLPGADTETGASGIVTPLERQSPDCRGHQMTSSSAWAARLRCSLIWTATLMARARSGCDQRCA
jgi:multidrug efflux pump